MRETPEVGAGFVDATLKSRAEAISPMAWAADRVAEQEPVERHEGHGSERSADSREGKPLEGEPQGRFGHETRPWGRLRSKPLGG
jgi:hypothetical protein